MHTPMPRPLLLVFSLLATLSLPLTLPAQVLSSGHTSSVTPDTTQQFDPETGLPEVEEIKLDTTQRFDPETGLPGVEEAERDTTLQFDSETGLPLSKPSIQPQELPISPEPGAGESAMQRPVVDEKFKPRQVFDKQRFPIQFNVGRPIVEGWGMNLALSYRFSKSIYIEGSRDIYESFYMYPALTLGFNRTSNSGSVYLESNSYEHYSVVYGIIEGHRQWEMKNLLTSVFLGVGLGRYEERSEETIWNPYSYESHKDAGTGLVLSAGAQARVWRLMGGLRLYRTPGSDKFVAVVNAGYQPKSSKEIWIVAGVGAVIAVPLLIFLLIFPGS